MGTRPRTTPDRAALEIAHKKLATTTPLDTMLQNPAYRTVLENMARRHMRRRERFDPRRAAANDTD